MTKRAKPIDYDQTIADKICMEVANGSNLNKLCKQKNMPSRSTVYVWFEKYQKFKDKYARAREDRADYRFDEAEQVLQDMRDGKISYQEARIILDTIKWQAGKEKPKQYGEKITHAGDQENPIATKMDDRDRNVLKHFYKHYADRIDSADTEEAEK